MWAVVFCPILAFAGSVRAQDVPRPPPSQQATDDEVTTLDAVRATAPRPEPEVVDVYRFRNPVKADGTRFDQAWHEPPSLEEIGKNGGVIPMAVGYLVEKAGKGLQRLPGVKSPIRYADARPAPLDEEQMRRAASLRAADDAAPPGQ